MSRRPECFAHRVVDLHRAVIIPSDDLDFTIRQQPQRGVRSREHHRFGGRCKGQRGGVEYFCWFYFMVGGLRSARQPDPAAPPQYPPVPPSPLPPPPPSRLPPRRLSEPFHPRARSRCGRPSVLSSAAPERRNWSAGRRTLSSQADPVGRRLL